MNTQKDSSHLKVQTVLLVGIGLAVSFFAVKGAGIVSSRTQQPTQETPLRPQVKKFVNRVPKHLPLKVKIKNGDNEKWVRDLEVEVTNTSDKPIYFLEFFIVMPDVKSINGNPIGIPLRYGRIELISYTAPLQSDDVPIQPGETYIFRAPETNVRGWERNKIQESRPEPKRVELKFVQLNFGDGTGFHRTDGSPVPRRTSGSSAASCYDVPQNSYRDKLPADVQARGPNRFPALFLFSLPAKALPVIFFGIRSSFFLSTAIPARPDLCCPGTICNYKKATFYGCACITNARTTQSAPCSDPIAECSIDGP